MGRAVVALIDRELVSVFGDHTGDYLPVLAEQADEELTRRQEQVARREEDVSLASDSLMVWDLWSAMVRQGFNVDS